LKVRFKFSGGLGGALEAGFDFDFGVSAFALGPIAFGTGGATLIPFLGVGGWMLVELPIVGDCEGERIGGIIDDESSGTVSFASDPIVRSLSLG
jgi:hypothetical protein